MKPTSAQQKLWTSQRSYVAEHSAFYRDHWFGHSVPRDLLGLSELPLSDKAQLRSSQQVSPPLGDYLAAPETKVSRLHRTSGTTGQAMNLALSARDANQTEEVGGRCQALAGLNSSHRVVHCLNYQLWMGGLTDHLCLEKTGALVVPFGVGSTDKLIRTIQQLSINAISCTPSFPAVLEQVISQNFPQLDPRDLGLKLGLFGGEPGLDEAKFRARLCDVWGMEPRNANYGVTDVMCNFAAQCTHDDSLHFLAGDCLFAELIDPDTTRSLEFESGVQGELVLTHLARECQPLVRFRTGDIIRITGTSRCRCNSGDFRFKVIGRCDDMVVVRGINVFPTMVSAVISNTSSNLGDYRILLGTPPPYDRLHLQIEWGDGAVDQMAERVQMEIKQNIKRELGVSATIDLVPLGTWALTEAKTQRVIRQY